MNLSSATTRGSLSIAIGAGLWGLFWIPLRHLDSLGVNGLWSVALVSLTATNAALIIVIVQRESAALWRRDVLLVALPLGLSTVLYFAGVLFSDVIRVVFLFYLLPVWTTLAARVLYGERIQAGRYGVIAAALVGLWLLLGGGARLPLPSNFGDACGLAAGFCWGVSLARLRGHASTPPLVTTAATLTVASVLALAAALVLPLFSVTTDGGSTASAALVPERSTVFAAMPLAIAFGVLVLFPALFSQVWGARLVPAPTAALLTMSEILVATLSATWLIGTELEPLAWLGGGLIVAAVLLDLKLQQAGSG